MGKVYLVGAGPGAPDLLTLRAARLLERADIVFHDALVHPDTIALAVRAAKVAVGKRAGQVSTDQRFINRQLVEAARHHAVVVRLKGGDPMIFGRAQEEIDALQAAAIEYEVVPGITAALAASAQLGRSLTRRGLARTVSFATPRVGPGEKESDWLDAAVAADSTVLYMAAGDAPRIAQRLIDAGKSTDTPVAIVENTTWDNEQRIFSTLGALTASSFQFTGPAVLCVGQVFAIDKVHSARMREVHATQCQIAG
jgi:uroporphyrin-III C-methyltransferase